MTIPSPAPDPREPGRLRALAADVRALPREAWVVFAGTFINRFGSFVLTFLILILVRRGFTPAQAGLAASMYGVGGIGAAMVGGHLADRIGRRRTIALSMFSSAAAMLALWRAGPLPEVAAVTALAGFCAEMYRPAAAALLADVTPRGRRVGTYALYRLFINVGFALGPATMGFFAQRSIGVVFVGDAVTSVLYGLLVLFLIPRRVDQGVAMDGDADAPRGPSALRLIARDGAMVAFLVAMTMMSVVHTQDMASVPLELGARGFTTAQYGVLISLNGFLCVLLELPVAAVTARMVAWIPLSAGAILIGLGIAATGVAHGVPAYVVTVLLWTLGEVIAFPVAHAFVADLAPKGLQGRYQASLGFTQAMAFVIAPAAGAALFGWSRPALWAACAVLGVAAALTFSAVGRARRVRTVGEEMAAAEIAAE
ncbi:MFS transporter [Longimicrobium sp.]|uniref:MFS transporter n=1 Tax=Longimicrobium sp. TaxID=2029185 RepID=UPI002CD114C9|nr:MFS transporter [Longimicrobium sp.]HSU18005.1 MFS transporter [Longimicrobium sp.]